jgi:hypothetical protein
VIQAGLCEVLLSVAADNNQTGSAIRASQTRWTLRGIDVVEFVALPATSRDRLGVFRQNLIHQARSATTPGDRHDAGANGMASTPAGK